MQNARSEQLAQEVGHVYRFFRRMAVAIAVLVGVGVPAGFLTLSVPQLLGELDEHGVASSRAVSRFAYGNPEYWPFEAHRIEKLLHDSILSGEVDAIQVLAKDIGLAVEVGSVLGPTLTRDYPIDDGALRVGTVRVTTSLRPTLLITAGLTVLSVILAFAIYLGSVYGPNRMVTRAFDRVREYEGALETSESRLRSVIDNSPTAVVLKGLDGRIRLFNSRFQEWFGGTSINLLGLPANKVFPAEHATALAEQDYESLRSDMFQEAEYEMTLADGSERMLSITSYPIRDSQGELTGVGAFALDITEHQQMEEQLRQAQKMEIVGQLTGGVAHDFNNLLAVILGNVELLEDEFGEDDKRVQTTIHAALRGAELTQRLLAFSRKQPLKTQIIDIDELTDGMTEMLRRSLGETIEIELDAEPGLWRASCDPGQVEAALLNLALNARDAMPDGGKLSIKAVNAVLDERYAARQSEVLPGDYVLLSVSDTGVGIPRNVLDRVFEPFFTTKGVGKGSGLGLSMIYGFAKQSGGHITIDSVEGEGTTVELYLPRGEEILAQDTDQRIAL